MSPRGTGWLVVLGSVVVGAAVQAATAVPGLGTASTPVLVADAAVSVVALVLELALLAWATRAIVHRAPLGRLPGRLLLWSLLVAVVTAISDAALEAQRMVEKTRILGHEKRNAG